MFSKFSSERGSDLHYNQLKLRDYANTFKRNCCYCLQVFYQCFCCCFMSLKLISVIYIDIGNVLIVLL